MYRCCEYSDEHFFQKGFNNLALVSLVDVCNAEKKGTGILEDYAGIKGLEVGADEKLIDEICKIIKKNKKLVLNHLKECGINDNRVIDDDKFFNDLLFTFKLLSDEKELINPPIEIEYIIGKATIYYDEYNMDVFNDILETYGEDEAIKFCFQRFYEDEKMVEHLIQYYKEEFEEVYDDIDEEDYKQEFVDYLLDTLFADGLVGEAFADIDFTVIDDDPRIASLLVYGDTTVDKLMSAASMKNARQDEER